MVTRFDPQKNSHTIDRFRRFWRAELTEPLISLYTRPDYRQIGNDDEIVTRACACIREDEQSGRDDILPCFWPDFGTISTAAIWGGTIIAAHGERRVHIEPIVTEARDLDRLCPVPFEHTDFQRAWQLYQRVRETLGGEVFLRLPDFQGPMNTLSLMVPQTDLFFMLHDEPDRVGRALSHITDILIEYVDRLMTMADRERIVGTIWPYVCLPGDIGVSLTQDYMPLLSPELYAEFEIPCLKRISDHFGGVFVHCCGQYAHHLENLRRSGVRLLGLEFHHPATCFEDLFAVFGDEIVYVPFLAPQARNQYPDMASYVPRLSAAASDQTRFWFASSAGEKDAELGLYARSKVPSST